jgi:two-component system NtrC family sensor kinase
MTLRAFSNFYKQQSHITWHQDFIENPLPASLPLVFATTFPAGGGLSVEDELYISMNNGVYDLYLRNVVVLPGSVVAGWSLARYGETKEALSRKGSRNLTYAGYAVLVYGCFAGLLPSGVRLAGIPVEVFRGISALAILLYIMRALRIFDDERKLKIQQSLKRFAECEKLIALGKLSAGVAHEINNPLSNVLLSLEMLENHLSESGYLSGKSRERIEAAKRNLDRAAKIARELLFYSQEREAEFVPVNLNDIVETTLGLLDSRRDSYDILLMLGEIPDVSGIPWKIEEILLNLLMNAMEASSPGGAIEITTRVQDAHICCAVRDHGSGISEQNLARVFDPFFTSKDPGEGTGLGLSICFGIMQMHGGEIQLESKERHGTTAQLLFPMKKGAISE